MLGLKRVQDRSAQSGHQLRPQPGLEPGAVGKNMASLQTSAGTAITQQHSAQRANTAKTAWDVPALIGTRAGGLDTFINI